MSGNNDRAAIDTYIIGSVVAGLISWSQTQSLGWTLLHVMGGWIYVIYGWAQGYIHWGG